jgi:mono/diheme cytochrome c family protein
MPVRTLAVLVAGLFGIAATAFAADPPKQGWSFGKDQYNARCAPCHGVSGKGNGPAAKQLQTKLPDLTTYAKRNGGAFPTELAWQKIDGRPTSWSEERGMPVWGRDFRHEAMQNTNATKKPETYVAAEIYAIVEHLRSMQVK